MVDFDLDYLKNKFDEYNIPFDLGRNNERVKIRKARKFFAGSKADMPGRQVLDCLNMLAFSFIKVADYKLETVANHILGEGKTIKGYNKHIEIDRLYQEDQEKLIAYNFGQFVDCFSHLFQLFWSH